MAQRCNWEGEDRGRKLMKNMSSGQVGKHSRVRRQSVGDVAKCIKTTTLSNSHKDNWKILVITVRKGSRPEEASVNRWSRNIGQCKDHLYVVLWRFCPRSKGVSTGKWYGVLGDQAALGGTQEAASWDQWSAPKTGSDETRSGLWKNNTPTSYTVIKREKNTMDF